MDHQGHFPCIFKRVRLPAAADHNTARFDRDADAIIETDIANARKYYNANVRMFNTKLETFPTRLIAKKFGFTKQPMYEVPNEAERENVKVQF